MRRLFSAQLSLFPASLHHLLLHILINLHFIGNSFFFSCFPSLFLISSSSGCQFSFHPSQSLCSFQTLLPSFTPPPVLPASQHLCLHHESESHQANQLQQLRPEQQWLEEAERFRSRSGGFQWPLPEQQLSLCGHQRASPWSGGPAGVPVGQQEPAGPPQPGDRPQPVHEPSPREGADQEPQQPLRQLHR